MSQNWYTLAARGKGKATMNLYGDIGAWGITAADFDRDLKALGDIAVLDLYINSNGGEVFAGLSMYNILNRHPATINVHIDGVAASIASVIAMVGDTINIADNGMMMIHNPAGFVSGDSRDMRQIANVLDKIKNNVIDIYSKKSGKDRDDVWNLMDDETWYTAQEAVDEGFADKVTSGVHLTNKSLGDFSKFANTPTNLGEILLGKPAQRNQGGSDMTEPTNAATTTTTPPAPAPAAPAPVTPVNATVTAPVAVATAPAATQETEAQMRARISGELTAYRAQIADICNLSGRPDLIDGFVNENKPVAEVIAALKAATADSKKPGSARTVAASGQAPDVSNRHAPANGNSEVIIDTAKIYSNWNNPKKRG